MFRRITVLASALALFVAGALSWTAAAAPITGSFTVDIVFYPQQDCTVDPGTLEIICPVEDPINKIDRSWSSLRPICC
jgi:type 1 fimbria pilin